MRKHRNISIGTIIGVLVGAVLTFAVLQMAHLHGGSEDYMWLLWPIYLVLWLPRHLCELVGVDWPMGGHYFPSSIRLIYAANSVAFGLAGALCGFLLRFIPLRKPEQSSEPYRGPRCVACNEPMAFGITLCPKCGYTQPA